MPHTNPLTPNSPAPEFTLPDQAGRLHRLSEYRGGWVLLYFYPKDDTPGCVKEACAVRDALPDFQKLGITALGVSVDSVASHKKFAEKYSLPFTLLADEEKVVVQLYGVWAKKNLAGKVYHGTLRTSFLINPDGMIAKVYENVKPETHAEEVLRDMRQL